MSIEQKDWIEDLKNYFNEFCESVGMDCFQFSFRVVETENRQKALFMYSQGQKKKTKIIQGWCGDPVSIPGRHILTQKHGKDDEKFSLIEKRFSKIVACITLLSRNTVYREDISELLVNKGGLWLEQLANVKRDEPDYGFMSFLDLASEEDCLTGLLYLMSVVTKNEMKALGKLYSHDDLMSRSRLIAQVLREKMEQNSVYNHCDLSLYGESIFWGKIPEMESLTWRKNASCSPSILHSPREWKEIEKLICFLDVADDNIKYKDFKTPRFSVRTSRFSFREALRKADPKKLVSVKMVKEVLNEKNKSEIIESVMSLIEKAPNNLSVTELIELIVKEENNLKQSEEDQREPRIDLIENLVNCWKALDRVSDRQTSKEAAQAIMSACGRCSCLEQPNSNAFLIAEMLNAYLESTLSDIVTFCYCIDLIQVGDSAVLFNGLPYGGSLIIEKMRENRADEELILFIADGARFHNANKEKKALGKTAWKKIVENPEDFKDLPYEWVYGMLS